jgi:hypothetical protein
MIRNRVAGEAINTHPVLQCFIYMVYRPLVPRSRFSYVILALVTIAAGLVMHRATLPFGAVTRDMAGDALWAMMMVWWIGALRPRTSPGLKGAIALGICILVETSQLIHGPVIDPIRASPLGHLVLGSGFDPRDFVAYAIGAVLAGTIDGRLMAGGPADRDRRRRPAPT